MNKIFNTILVFFAFGLSAQSTQQFSTAGFYNRSDTPREVFDFSGGWRFYKGDVPNAFTVQLNDESWELVNLPHGLEALPYEASGGMNYQGVAWYRKHFTPTKANMKGRVYLHFEAIMGKCVIYIDGKEVETHFGGYLPIHLDITDFVSAGKSSLIAIKTDNSNDPMYPPGRPQQTLDFAYFGGIYRDVWLITTEKVHISNPNHADKVAGGGVFVRYEDVSESSAVLVIQTDIVNHTSEIFTGKLVSSLSQRNKAKTTITVPAKTSKTIEQRIKITNPKLWDPDNPYLYTLSLIITDRRGKLFDGFDQRIGIRTLEFRGKEGMYLNGKFYEGKLMGVNRHQDFAVLGNALPNNGQWRDAKKLRDAGVRVIRSAHYPMDPAFMDACDELGLFVIVATPGWQFWNKAPIFEQRVIKDIRQMVRRDRNHPSVFLWEPILNETHYPNDFAQKTHNTVKEEYPYPGAYTACDAHANGAKYFDVWYAHPLTRNSPTAHLTEKDRRRHHYDAVDKTVFTREFGDNVDDWNSQNSSSRMSREWGEVPQLVQAWHYAHPDYPFTSWEELYETPKQHVGGTLWHSFDHQRGYHNDPFYGGIMDAYRQPKYSYYLFAAQDTAAAPMVYIAHEMSPFSPSDITVYSNCDAVRLTYCGEVIKTLERKPMAMPSPIFLFKDVYKFMDIKYLHRGKKFEEAYIQVEGINNGQVVATAKRKPAKRSESIRLRVDNEGKSLLANGSDMVVVIAEVVDRDGIVKRLSNEFIKLEVSGEGFLVDTPENIQYGKPVKWGSAPFLIRSTNKPGEISVKASLLYPGKSKPIGSTIILNSSSSSLPALQDEWVESLVAIVKEDKTIDEESQNNLKEALKKVEKQQEEFEEKH